MGAKKVHKVLSFGGGWGVDKDIILEVMNKICNIIIQVLLADIH